MQVAHMLRQRLEKTAISMSLFAKQNAANQDSIVGANWIPLYDQPG